MDDKFHVYILHSSTTDSYYVGHTNDVNRRLEEHNDLFANHGKCCVKNGPWVLKYSESDFDTRADAMKREKQIKAWKSKKMIEKLINGRSQMH